jgi:hypothetical protein
MTIATHKQMESTMLKKVLLAVSTAAAALGFSGFALADPPHWAPAHGWRAQHYYPRHSYYAPRPFVVVPAPRVVYAPPPPVAYPYYAAPVVVRPAVPVYPVPAGVSIRFNFPL